jgi:hypothetical protein
MVNYSNGKVYKLVSFSSDNVYYGSTCSQLSRRLAGHKCAYNRWKADKRGYITSFEVMKYTDAEIVLVESVNCTSKEELHAAERKHVENNVCTNKQVPGRSNKEYCDKYRQDNRHIINEKILCECGKYSTRVNAARHKRSKKHLKYLLSIADTDTEDSSENSSYEFDGVPHAKNASL